MTQEETPKEEATPEELTVEERFLLSPGPHLRSWYSVSRIMYIVALALIFPTAAGVYFFGFQALWVVIVAIVSAVATEYGVKKLRGRPFIMDGGAVVTGLLLALILPPTMPLWMVVVGSILSIAIVKEAFGGLGFNIFNPALGGRALLMAAWLVETTTWVPTRLMPDAVTTATPLSMSFVWEGSKTSLWWDLFIGNTGGSIGETSALAILVGGGLLLALGLIEWRIPVTYIGTVALLTLIWPGTTLPIFTAPWEDALFHVLAGGLMLGAFFMATDYVTSPITYRGKIIFGIGCGVTTVIVRLLGGMPEGVCFSILLMNALTPIIDKYTMVKPFGLKKVRSEG